MESLGHCHMATLGGGWGLISLTAQPSFSSQSHHPQGLLLPGGKCSKGVDQGSRCTNHIQHKYTYIHTYMYTHKYTHIHMYMSHLSIYMYMYICFYIYISQVSSIQQRTQYVSTCCPCLWDTEIMSSLSLDEKLTSVSDEVAIISRGTYDINPGLM
jgi:hypothetical protein